CVFVNGHGCFDFVLTLASNRAPGWQAHQVSMIKTGLLELKTVLRPVDRLLGRDLGEKTIGLALSDTLLTVASPFRTLKRGKFAADAAVLGALLAEHGVGGRIIGLPLNMDGSEGPSAQSARAFARNFAKVSDC